ncbi:MAG TPA: ABC transporter permease [Desulfurella acetivorans]|uniref:ABC transporter permease n=1 Tax=Desulfurella acetivorans TaxID=33002 RepID=A0A7C6A744_DESAE|nr:ABC transporter permease [Desulfurella acetivorans]
MDQQYVFFDVKDKTLFLKGSWVVENLELIKKRLANFVGFERVDISLINEIDTFGGLLICDSFDLSKICGNNKRVESVLKLVLQNKSQVPAVKKKSLLLRFSNYLENKIKDYIFFLNFLGKSTVDFISKISDFEFRIFVKDIQNMGVGAVGIVGVLSFLIGLVIAYQSAAQLRQFGANIFIVDLVSISIVRELGPLIVAIIVSARSASSYAASIGLMKVQEEIDTLDTMGVSPYTLLVLPRILSLFIVMPLLIVFADIVGIFGGMIISNLILNVNFAEFLERASRVVTIKSFLSGIVKGPVFGIVIALIGTSEGFKVEQKTESIGFHVTASVVKSIFSIIAIDAAFSVIYRWLKI